MKSRGFPPQILLLLLLSIWVTSSSAAEWEELTPSGTPPEARWGQSTGYDEANNRLIIFGGSIGDFTENMRNDVHVLSSADGTGGTPTWTALSPTGTAPSARAMAEGTYDPVSNRLILRGGVQLEFCSSMTDMYILTEANGLGGTPNWVSLSPTGGPPPGRQGAYLGFDPATNRAILFGGQVLCSPTVFNDVWVLTDANGTGGTPNWTQLTPTGGPPAGRAAMENGSFYDPTLNQLIVFGGNPGLDDTWVLENANGLGGTPNWVQVSASHPDGDRNSHFGIYDTITNQYIFHGGGDPANGNTFYDTVWALSNADGTGGSAVWAETFPTGTPPGGRHRSSGGYRASTNRLFFFGGLDGNLWFLGARTNDMVTNSVFVLKLVPEPSGWLMLSAGIGLVAVLHRFRGRA